MCEAEWRIVSLGMQMHERLIAPWLQARAAERAAEEEEKRGQWWRLPPEELRRRWNNPEELAKRAE